MFQLCEWSSHGGINLEFEIRLLIYRDCALYWVIQEITSFRALPNLILPIRDLDAVSHILHPLRGGWCLSRLPLAWIQELLFPRIVLDIGKRDLVSRLQKHHYHTIALHLLAKYLLLTHLSVVNEAQELMVLKVDDSLPRFFIRNVEHYQFIVLRHIWLVCQQRVVYNPSLRNGILGSQVFHVVSDLVV